MKIKKSTFYMVVLLFLFVVAMTSIKQDNPWLAIPVMVIIFGIIVKWSIERFKETHRK